MITIHHHKLRMIDPFGISRGTQSQQDVVLIRIGDGWGEAAASNYNREQRSDILRALEVADAALEQYTAGDAGRLDFIEDVEDAVWAAIDALPERATHPHKTFRGPARRPSTWRCSTASAADSGCRCTACSARRPPAPW